MKSFLVFISLLLSATLTLAQTIDTPATINDSPTSLIKNRMNAIANYDRAIAADPKNGNAYFQRGLLKRTMSNYGDAIADFTIAIALNPEFRSYNERGITKKDLKLY